MELRRSLTLYTLTMVAIGSTIGSGIFRTPGKIAAGVHLQEYVILLWVLGGVVALTGALTFAEMGSMFPGAGGLYVYLREAYGDAVAFLYGWFILFISTSGSIAAVVLVCAEHILYALGQGRDSPAEIPLALGIIGLLTAMNVRGVNWGKWIADLFTGAKLLGLLILIAVGLLFARPDVAAINASDPVAHTPPTHLISALAVAFIGVLWSYGGWQHASYMAGETINPQRNVPRAMIIGALTVTTVYVLANVAYMRLLPMNEISGSKTIAADALSGVFAWGGWVMALLIAVSTFGTAGIYCMTAPRIYFAMARDGIFFKKIAEVHPRWRTPANAILAQSVWSAILLLFWGAFEELIEYVTFMDWVGLMLVGVAVFVFRIKRPEAPRPYRTPGYPLVPSVFILISVWFVAFTLYNEPINAWAGIAVLAIGYAAYLFLFRKK